MGKWILIGLFLLSLSGCINQKREFSKKDFLDATKFLCQKDNFKGSPLNLNTFVLYYDKEKKLGNIGQYVYSTWNDNGKVGEAHLYATDEALVLDDSILLILERLDSNESLHVSIDRKSLAVSMDYHAMKCEVVTDEVLHSKKEKLVESHQRYKAELEKNNKI